MIDASDALCALFHGEADFEGGEIGLVLEDATISVYVPTYDRRDPQSRQAAAWDCFFSLVGEADNLSLDTSPLWSITACFSA